MVKSVQDGVRHNSACSVETMPMPLQMYGEIRDGFFWLPGEPESWVGIMRPPIIRDTLRLCEIL